MKTTNHLFIAIVLFLSTASFSAKHDMLGLAAGATTGNGISYRHWFDKNAYQITFAPMGHYRSNSSDNWIWINFGATGLYSFLDTHKNKLGNMGTFNGRFLGYYGFRYIYSYEAGNAIDNLDSYYEQYPYTTKSNFPDESIQHSFSIGTGLGFELSFSRLVFSLMFGYKVTDEELWFDKYNDVLPNGKNERVIDVSPSVEASLHFGFGHF